jgi:hypothetical protein
MVIKHTKEMKEATEFYKKWYFKTQGIECGEPLSNELIIIKFAEEFAAEQIKELTEGVNKTIEAWESLDEGHYSIDTISDWLLKQMKPAIDKLRELNKP